MKTISKITLVLGLLMAFFSTNSVAQSSLVELQTMQTTLNDEIALLNSQIQSAQQQVDINNEIIAAGKPENDLAQLQIEVQENLSFITDLQTTLALKQIELTALQGKIEGLTTQQNALDRQWIQQHVVVPANQVNGPQYTPAGAPVQNIPNPNVKEDPNAPSISIQ